MNEQSNDRQSPETAAHQSKPLRALGLGEDLVSILILSGMVALPIIQALYRKLFGLSLIGADSVVQHGTMLLTFSAAALAARENSHLRFDTVLITRDYGLKSRIFKLFSHGTSVGILICLAYASWLLISTGMEGHSLVGRYVPVWVAQLVMPLSLAAIGLRFVIHGSDSWRWRAGILAFAAVFPLLALIPEGERGFLAWPGAIVIVLAVVFGAPIFILMGGMAALLFFMVSGDGISALIDIPDAAYTIVTNPFLPAIPLFTLAGAVLAHGNTSQRLVGFFRALFGSLPGGVAIATALLFGFFTTFTGASGVTILALGPLLMPLLVKNLYPERFSLGLLSSTGSLGILFPPCLPVILIGVVLAQPIDKMFMAGFIPGLMLVMMIVTYSVIQAKTSKVKRSDFDGRELWKAAKKAKWELLLPVIVLGGIFGGITTLVESAAVTALYAIIVEVFIHKDFDIKTGLREAFIRGILLVGGILIIIAFAKGFTQYLIDGMIAESVAEWVQGTIRNKYAFLIVLNILLLVVGSLMDIVSAIIVIVPLVSPMLGFYGIHPIHFGIIFLVNLEIGFLTPPVGMNLFMSSYTFGKPLTEVYRSVIPFILLWLAGVLLVSYVPWLTLALLGIE